MQEPPSRRRSSRATLDHTPMASRGAITLPPVENRTLLVTRFAVFGYNFRARVAFAGAIRLL